ncbi:hypothetical protein NPIL_375141 [Nephila pilipes]|uniref:Uncharacterized protein n=1 Tax=Nephila pilipes TaxID=299642 RepID=A0A8X6NXZ7_NEPPI|nr:hypothetical protein NPIL_375141 [Nephila pilipes]
MTIIVARNDPHVYVSQLALVSKWANSNIWPVAIVHQPAASSWKSSMCGSRLIVWPTSELPTNGNTASHIVAMAASQWPAIGMTSKPICVCVYSQRQQNVSYMYGQWHQPASQPVAMCNNQWVCSLITM